MYNELEQPNDKLMVCVGILCFRKYKSIYAGVGEGGSVITHKHRERLERFIERNDLVDIWRIFNLFSLTTYNYCQMLNETC